MKKILVQGRVFALLLIFLLVFSVAHSATITSSTSGGNWTNRSTWVGNRVPRTSDVVIIATTGTNSVQITANLSQKAAGSVTVNNGAKLTATGGTIIFGSLTINSGGTVTMYRDLTVLGATNIAGTINFGSTSTTSRALLFTDAVTLNSGAIWNETTIGAAATFSFGNNFTNNATAFTAQNTTHTFTGTAMTISGSTVTAIPNVTITGTRTNSGTLTVSTTLAGSGILTNAATGIINYGGSGAIVPTLAASTIGNTVNYTGAAQTSKVTTYHNLTLSGSGIKTFATTPTINGILSLEGTASVTVTGSGVVAYGSGATLQYNKPASYLATTEEWISPFTSTGGIIINNTGTITTPPGRTIGNGSSIQLQNGILAAATNLTMASTSTINRAEGSMTGTLQGSGIYNVNYTGNSKSTGPELSGSGLFNIAVNLNTAASTLTSSATAFTIDNNLTVTQGNLILQATDANYTITNDMIVASNGTLTHSVNWDGTSKLLRVNGNIAIDGRFAYTVRSHLQMGGANKTIRTGPAPSSLSILTLVHTGGNISASGLVTVDDNFWASFNTPGGTFATAGNTVFAKSALLNAGGTVNINGGTLNVTGGLYAGYQALNGAVTLSSGTLNSDFIHVGDGTRTGTFSQSGGTANISGNLVINPSCSYTCANSPAINIGGNFVNNGTFVKATEAITFSGSAQADISGSSNTEFNNLSVSNTGGVTTQLGLLTANNLVIASGSKFTIPPQKFVTVNGTLTLNDSIILRSTSAGTASLVTNGVVTGSKARVERYINGVSWSWHFLSSPVAGQAISGGFTPISSGYDFYTWYEPELTWVNVKNTSSAPTWNTANGNTNFLPGRGYLVAYEATNTTKNFSGLLNSGTVSFPLTMGGGSTYQYFNLAGNPYPCSIDWEAATGWERSHLNGIQKSYWIWNDAAGNYGTYITGGSGTNGVTRYIPGGQGFIVLAETEGNMVMDDGVKVHSAKAYLKNNETTNNKLVLKLTCDVNSYSDEAIVEFNDYAPGDGSEKFNSIYTNAPEIWSVKNGNNYSINYLSGLSSGNLVPLTVKAGVAGKYTISASQIESFENNSAISLEDRVSGSITELGTMPSYTFEVSEPTTIADRFFLRFLNVSSAPDPKVAQQFSIYATNRAITVTSLQQLGGKIAVFDMLGRAVAKGRLEAGGSTQIDIQGQTGVYIVSVITSQGISNTKILVR